jgi:hypothetical protein
LRIRSADLLSGIIEASSKSLWFRAFPLHTRPRRSTRIRPARCCRAKCTSVEGSVLQLPSHSGTHIISVVESCYAFVLRSSCHEMASAFAWLVSPATYGKAQLHCECARNRAGRCNWLHWLRPRKLPGAGCIFGAIVEKIQGRGRVQVAISWRNANTRDSAQKGISTGIPTARRIPNTRCIPTERSFGESTNKQQR